MKKSTLYTRLALVVSLVACLLVAALSSLIYWSNEQYHRELTQRLHGNLAQYVLDHLSGPLFKSSNEQLEVDYSVLKGIAMNTMMINPSVEVYLLSPEGEMLGHALPEASVDSANVDVEPIQRWLSSQQDEAVVGGNPRDPEVSNIFSVAPVFHDDVMQGYLYIVLASHEVRSLASSLEDSYVARVVLASMAALVMFFVLSSGLVFRQVTNPLRQLAADIRAYRKENLVDTNPPTGDEVEEIEQVFGLMKDRIQSQFDQLAENDQLRRELVSNISHDLRTPLSSMQGYLETLIIKSDALSEGERARYLSIAHRNSKHLSDLVAQLFELSKLEAGKVEVLREQFSLSELLSDLSQDYELAASKHGTELVLDIPAENVLVNADICLIQRALSNLLDNALVHNNAQGKIRLVLEVRDEKVRVKVKDSGDGIAEKDLPYVFERFYQSSDKTSDKGKSGAGLGLSIVKKIIELHDSLIEVNSRLQEGTEFSFELQRA